MLARAARDANIPFIMSGAATAKMEDLAREAPDHGWYQLYTAKDRSISEDQVKRAADLVPDPRDHRRRTRERQPGAQQAQWFQPGRSGFPGNTSSTRCAVVMAKRLHRPCDAFKLGEIRPSGSSAHDVGEYVAGRFPGPLTWKDIRYFPQALVWESSSKGSCGSMMPCVQRMSVSTD